MHTLKIIRKICLETITIVGPKIRIMVACFAMRNTLSLYHPYGIKLILESIESKSSTHTLRFWCGISILAFSLSNIFDMTGEYLKDKLMRQGRSAKILSYLQNISSKDYATLISKPSGELITKINNCIDAEFEIAGMAFRKLPAFLIRTGIIVVMLYNYIPFALRMMPLLLLIPWGIDQFTKKQSNALSEELNILSETSSEQVLKIIQEQSTIRFSNQIQSELDTLDKINKKTISKEPKRNFLENIKSNIIGILFAIMEFGSYGYLGVLVMQGNYSIANLVMVGSYVRWFRYPLDIILDNIKSINKNIHKIETFYEFLDRPDNIKNGNESYIYHTGTIKLNSVSFSYEERQIFQDMSLVFPGGKTTALVGHSGSGKSTIIKLIMRLRDCDQGEIIIDTQNIKNIKISTWYDQIGYLTQEPPIFDGTIGENISYGIGNSKGVENGELNIWTALEQAQLADMVRSLPDGLETKIGDRGVKLSGGERQRLGLARMFLKNPKIIILDEPTSALDSISEHEIAKVMASLFIGKTVIVIAHRLQTVMHADNIYVLEQGKVVQSGKHEDLVSKDGLYKQLLDLQQGIMKE